MRAIRSWVATHAAPQVLASCPLESTSHTNSLSPFRSRRRIPRFAANVEMVRAKDRWHHSLPKYLKIESRHWSLCMVSSMTKLIGTRSGLSLGKAIA